MPEGTTLVGAGEMSFDGEGLPAGLVPRAATTLRVVAAFDGAVLMLGNGSRLERLRVIDFDTQSSAAAQRRGNVVQVASRKPGDLIDAFIVECEFVNPNLVGFAAEGPIGHGVAVLTVNPNREAAPVAHEGARVSVQLRRSIVRTNSGAVVFANNFAARGRITLRLEGNRFDGRLIAAGGTSRGDAVRDSVTWVTSLGNRYARSGSERHGWLILGGSSSPHFDDNPGNGASGNLLHVDSIDDRIEGFHAGVQASAARRIGLGSQPLDGNRLELNLERTRIRTEGRGAADLQLQAAWSEIAQAEGPGEFPAGDDNVLHVRISNSSGSGARLNAYAHVSGPDRPENKGTGNRLEIEGRRDVFLESNRQLDPPPAAEFFVGEPSLPRG